MKTDLVVATYPVLDNKVLLIFHKKLQKWLPPGGHIEANETPDDAVIREMQEELSMDVRIVSFGDTFLEGTTKRQLATPFQVAIHSVGDHDHCCFFYVCVPLSPVGDLEAGAIEDARWFSANELEQRDDLQEDVRLLARKALVLMKNR